MSPAPAPTAAINMVQIHTYMSIEIECWCRVLAPSPWECFAHHCTHPWPQNSDLHTPRSGPPKKFDPKCWDFYPPCTPQILGLPPTLKSTLCTCMEQIYIPNRKWERWDQRIQLPLRGVGVARSYFLALWNQRRVECHPVSCFSLCLCSWFSSFDFWGVGWPSSVDGIMRQTDRRCQAEMWWTQLRWRPVGLASSP